MKEKTHSDLVKRIVNLQDYLHDVLKVHIVAQVDDEVASLSLRSPYLRGTLNYMGTEGDQNHTIPLYGLNMSRGTEYDIAKPLQPFHPHGFFLYEEALTDELRLLGAKEIDAGNGFTNLYIPPSKHR